MKKMVAFFLILLGIGTMLYPFMYHRVSSYQQDRLLQKWDEIKNKPSTVQSEEVPDRETAEKNYAHLTEIFRDGRNKSVEKEKVAKPDIGDLLGILQIKKIDARIPILEGATLPHLQHAAGHITGTALPGAFGNSAIAAHNGFKYGRMFNRLHEINRGDKVVIDTKNGTYIYTVYQKRLIKPSDFSILKNKNQRERTLTLITCYPRRHPTSRLIVKARVISSERNRG